MAEVQKKPVKIVETVLRDAHQSLLATRMSTDQMLPIVDKMDKVGYYAVECWGGATFDASLRFLKEDPWERLRKLRDGFNNTKLQMLFRGQNILGYNHYADDVVEYFVQKSIANGIDIIRIFDCLNDIRNLETAVKATNKEKGHAQIALSYTLGDAYTLDYWKNIAREIEEMGADSLCIKDMAGLLTPYKAAELVQALKEGNFEKFLKNITASGNSSWKWLQNCFTNSAVQEQGITIALALTELFIAEKQRGACRVHGGGFAGVIMAMLPNDLTDEYIRYIEGCLGEGCAYRMSIRPYGAVCINELLK